MIHKKPKIEILINFHPDSMSVSDLVTYVYPTSGSSSLNKWDENNDEWTKIRENDEINMGKISTNLPSGMIQNKHAGESGDSLEANH